MRVRVYFSVSTVGYNTVLLKNKHYIQDKNIYYSKNSILPLVNYIYLALLKIISRVHHKEMSLPLYSQEN